jgi:hypothetical protein
VLGPVDETGGAARIDPAAIDLEASVDDGRGRKLSWRRIDANSEGLVDLGILGAVETGRAAAAYASTPVVTPVAQKAHLVLDSPAEVAVWLQGKPVPLSPGRPNQDQPRTALVDLPRGAATLLIRMALDGRSAARAHLVTTFVVDQPVAFSH